MQFLEHGQTNTGYHTVIDYKKAKALKPLKITVTAAQGSVINNPFGSGVVGTYPINNFEREAHTYMTAHNAVITPDTFPFFISYDIYLTSGGCCIGGYHNRSGNHGTGQTYGYTTLVDSPGAFSMDIDAVSHEVAEWLDDPFVDNHVNCNDNSILEVGDPIEGKANYGTFPVNLNGYTWHPQDEAQLPYFGAPTSTSANGWTIRIIPQWCHLPGPVDPSSHRKGIRAAFGPPFFFALDQDRAILSMRSNECLASGSVLRSRP